MSCIERRGDRGCHPRERLADEYGRTLTMARRWTQTEDTAVRLAAALDHEDGGERVRQLAERLGRTEAAVRWRAGRLRAAQFKGESEGKRVDSPMKALTVQQPWAWAIISGRKRVENRPWSTPVRGRIAIHSSRTADSNWWDLAAMLEDAATWEACYDSPYGAILGTVELVDCVEESDDYSFAGPPYYGFVLANPRPLRKPIQVRGRQRFWTIPPNIAGRLR